MAAETSLRSTERDVGTLVGVFLAVFLLHFCQRYLVGPKLSATYRHLDHATRFDWDQRVLNILFQLPQAFFNCYILFLCPQTAADPLWAYPSYANTGFIAIIAFYLYDLIIFLIHPHVSHAAVWVFHHVLAITLLTWQVIYQRTSALPSSVFLISASAHVLNETRWFLRTARVARMREWMNILSATCNLVMFATCVVPPPYLVWLAARSRGCEFGVMFWTHMRLYCQVAFLIVWLPHCAMVVAQMRRTMRHWRPKAD